MSLIDWLPSHNTGIAEIDIDNQLIVLMINQLHDSISNGNNQIIVNNVIRHLAQNYQDHFAVTTQILQRINYPNYNSQIESHKKFGKGIGLFLNKLKKGEKISTMELIAFLRNWFEKHILKEDLQIKNFIKENIKKTKQASEIRSTHVQPIIWKGSFQFDIITLDTQHENIAKIYNKLYNAVELEMTTNVLLKTLQSIKQLAETHFKDEEKLMFEIQYDNYEQHAQIHTNLLKELDILISKVSESDLVSKIQMLEYLRNWILNHLIIEDEKIHEFIEEQKELIPQE